MGVKTAHRELIACFLEQGFELDFEVTKGKATADAGVGFEDDLYKKYLDNRYKMLFYFGIID